MAVGAAQRTALDVERGPLALDGQTLTGIVVKTGSGGYTFSDAHTTASDVVAYESDAADYERLTGTARVERVDDGGPWVVFLDDVSGPVDLSDDPDAGGIAWFLPGGTDAEKSYSWYNVDDTAAGNGAYSPTYDDGAFSVDINLAQVSLVDGGGAGSPLTTIQARRASAATWTIEDPVLAAGEWGVELDTGKVKVGNGADSWTDLAYVSGDGSSLPGGNPAFILVDRDYGDPQDTPVALIEGAVAYFFTADGMGDWEYAGIYEGHSPDDATPAALTRAPDNQQPATGLTTPGRKFFFSRFMLNLSTTRPGELPPHADDFLTPRIGYISDNDGTNDPKFVLIMEKPQDDFTPTTAADMPVDPTGFTNSTALRLQEMLADLDGAISGGGGGGVSLSSATPHVLGTAAAGSGTAASRDDHVHAMPSASDVGAVPTARTLAGLDLTANRSASDIKTALSLAKGDVGLGNVTNDAQLKAASNLSDLANAGTARTNLGLGALATQNYGANAIRIIGSGRSTGSTPIVSPLVPVTGGASTIAVALGRMLLSPVVHSGQTVVSLYVIVSATSLTGSQAVEVVCYNDAGDGLPGTRAWSQTITVGTSTGNLSATSLSLAMPSGRCWVGVLNPSGNAGTVTLRTGVPMLPSGILGLANGSWPPVLDLTSVSASASDLSAYAARSSSTGATVLGAEAATTFPIVGAYV